MFKSNKIKKKETNRFEDILPTEMSSKWVWHDMIYLLIEKLNLTPTKVYAMNYIDALNWLSYFYEKSETEKNKKENKTL